MKTDKHCSSEISEQYCANEILSPQTQEKSLFSVRAPFQNTPIKISKYDNRAEPCEQIWENITVDGYEKARCESNRKSAVLHQRIYMPGILIQTVIQCIKIKMVSTKAFFIFSSHIAQPLLMYNFLKKYQLHAAICGTKM